MNELLKALLARATTPLTTLPKQAGNAASEALNNRGYGRTGAFVEGVGNTLSEYTSPLNIALNMALGPAASKFAGKLGPTAVRAAAREIPARTYTGPVAETLGEVVPDFTPVGGEGMFNVPKVKPQPNLEDILYQKAVEKFGMGR